MQASGYSWSNIRTGTLPRCGSSCLSWKCPKIKSCSVMFVEIFGWRKIPYSRNGEIAFLMKFKLANWTLNYSFRYLVTIYIVEDICCCICAINLTYTEKTIFPFPFHIEWDMIVCTVFLLILNQIDFHLVQNRKENCETTYGTSFTCV